MKMAVLKKIVSIVSALAIGMLLSSCSDNSDKNTMQGAKKVADIPGPPHSTISSELKKTWERPLKIGVIGPETGVDSVYGIDVLTGVMAAAKRFNSEGGIDGRNIEIINIDNEGDPGLTNLGVAYLINQEVIAILSAPTGWSTFAPIHQVNGSKTIFLSIGSRRRIERSGPYIFRAALPDELATDGLIRYATREFGYTSFALVGSSDYSYSLDINALFKKAVLKYGGTISVEADTYDSYLAKRNLKRVIDKIEQNSNVLQAVIFTGGVDEGTLFVKRLKNAGLNLPVIGGEDLFVDAYLKECGDIKGSLIYVSYSPLRRSSMMDEFIADIHERSPDRFVALAYDAFMLLAEAIKAAESTDSDKVRSALIRSEGYDGVTGKTRFTADGMPVKRPFIYGTRIDGNEEGFVLLEY